MGSLFVFKIILFIVLALVAVFNYFNWVTNRED